MGCTGKDRYWMKESYGGNTMLTRAKIRSLTHASFYARGVELYERGMVKQFHVENGTAVDRITAKVQGSGSKQYSVQARYAFTSDDMERCKL